MHNNAVATAMVECVARKLNIKSTPFHTFNYTCNHLFIHAKHFHFTYYINKCMPQNGLGYRYTRNQSNIILLDVYTICERLLWHESTAGLFESTGIHQSMKISL